MFFGSNRAWGTWCIVLRFIFFIKGGSPDICRPDTINRLKSIGNLRTRTIVRVWYRAEKNPRLARVIWFGAGAGELC